MLHVMIDIAGYTTLSTYSEGHTTPSTVTQDVTIVQFHSAIVMSSVKYDAKPIIPYYGTQYCDMVGDVSHGIVSYSNVSCTLFSRVLFTVSLALWLRCPPRERKIRGSNPASDGIIPVESYQ